MKTSPRSKSRGIDISRIILVVCVASYLLFAFVGFGNTLLGHHSFRQTQTALNVESLLEDWDVFGYRLPIEGPPWRQPYEFPVYQFITAVTVKLSGFNLIPAGRIVSIVAFLLSGFVFYRSMFLFLGSRKESMLCVSLFFLVPFYRFWSRSFMIETTALLFSLSWIYAMVKALDLKSIWWICIASIFGVIAGLAKSTTYFVALDFVFLCVLFEVFDSGFKWKLLISSGGWKYIFGQLFPIVLLTVGFPMICVLSWTKVSDLLKSDNYFSALTSSGVLTRWNFGTLEQRIDFGTWKRYYEHLDLGFFNPALIVVLLLLGFFFSDGKLRRFAAVCLLSFVVPLLVFTNLYFVHDYYFIASAVFLLMAICALGIGIFRIYPRFGYLYFITTLLLLGLQFSFWLF